MSKGYIIIIKIGHPCDPIMANINMGIDFNVMIDDKFNKFASNYLVLYGSEKISYENKLINAEKFSDTLSISFKYNVSNFMFYLIEKSNNITDIGTIGLAYKFTNIKNSLIHQLKEQNLIKKLAFGFGPELSEEDEGEIYLGGIPDPIKSQKEYAFLFVKDNDKYWACNLQYVYFNNSVQNGIVIEDFTYFQSNSQFIQVPNSFFQVLQKRIFDNYLKNNICVLDEQINKKQFICNCTEIKDFPNISFVIDGTVFEFDGLDLFERHYNNECVFYIEVNNNNSKKWILGIGFYKKSYTSFDYENNVIEFYRNGKKFPKIKIDNYLKISNTSYHSEIIQLFYVILVILLCFSTIFLILVNLTKFN